jgi:chitodextrinase
VFYRNDLVFVSNRKNDVFIVNTNVDNDLPLYDIYLAKQRRPGRFGAPQLFSKDISTRFNEGPIAFNKDGTVMYFTRTLDVSKGFGNSLRGDTALGIFTAQLVNDSWINITATRFNRPNYNVGFPFITEDGQQLFFCSEDPRGMGGYDIYISDWENGRWGPQRNLGSRINTAENDVFPFFHSSGRLYFASRGHDERTDLDIFYSDLVDNEWQEPVKMPAPFNSNADDFSFVIKNTMDTGFFASDRTGSRDIYIFNSTLPVFTNCPQQQENDYCYIFYELGSIDLDTTSFGYEWDLGDGTTIRGLEANHCYAEPGTYMVKLNVIDTLTGEIYFAQAVYEHLVEQIEQPFINMADTGYINENINFDGQQTYLKNFEIDDYYWDFGDGARATDVTAEHAFGKPGTYNIQLGVTSRVEQDNEFPELRCVTRPIIILRRRE